jgi:hypothetical protein
MISLLHGLREIFAHERQEIVWDVWRDLLIDKQYFLLCHSWMFLLCKGKKKNAQK